jgi:hypothetical protein
MKTTSTAVILSFIIVAIAAAQDSSQQPRRVVQQPDRLVTPTTAPQKENYKITIKGGVAKDAMFNLILQGSGPKFSTMTANPVKKVEVLVNEADGQLNVVYAIVANGVSQSDPKTSEVSSMEITGTFRPTLGQPFPILQIDEARLTIQIDKDSDEKK